MAENKKSFILYCDLIHTVDGLDEIEAGRLFTHLLRYVNDRNPEPPDRLTQLLFEPIKQQLKRDLKSWQETLPKRVESGKLGGIASGKARRSKTKQVLQSEASASETKQTKQSQANEPVTVTVTVNDTVNVNDNVTVNVKEKKVINIPPEVKKLRADCKQIFLDFYLHSKNTEYYWTAKDASNLIPLISKIESKVNERYPDGYEIDKLTEAFSLIIGSIKDQWVLDNLSIPIVNSKFNEIFTQIKNGKQTAKSKYEQSEFRN